MGTTVMSAFGRAALRAMFAVSIGGVAVCAQAADMQALDETELADVRGSNGIAFNLVNFSLAGPLSLTYTSPNGASLSLSNLALSRSDDPDATFSDPYTFKLVGRPGLADAMQLSEPLNANGLLKWQFAADWRVQADGITHDGGALVINDLVSRAGQLTLTTPATAGVDGIAFGLALNLDIGDVLLRPRGRADATEQLQLHGIRLGAAAEDGTPLGTPWALADASLQPGIINAVTDADGKSSLHVGIGWPTTTAGAPIGSLVIDNTSFKSDMLPGGQMDLGSSRIGTMQIQYLDVKLRPGL
ncbi:hypothetical protein [Ideonella sp. BN130291]|uniref:hypothetical protein n=1 Tax=Ideonella sp. BN130291 TaxID=3112940 RepID=UPI002E260AA1|nr:hypothetical protein [Ideonella sp. BN130291]